MVLWPLKIWQKSNLPESQPPVHLWHFSVFSSQLPPSEHLDFWSYSCRRFASEGSERGEMVKGKHVVIFPLTIRSFSLRALISHQHSTSCIPEQESWDHQEGGRKILAAGAQREIWKISCSCAGRGKILRELFNNYHSTGVNCLTLRKLLLQLLQTLHNVI